jgi:hypothetical protein
VAKELQLLSALLDARSKRNNVKVINFPVSKERDLLFDNLLVRIHVIIQMMLVDRPCAMGVWSLFSR